LGKTFQYALDSDPQRFGRKGFSIVGSYESSLILAGGKVSIPQALWGED
jgi:hypothetical protein